MIFNRENAPFVSLLAYRERSNRREGAAAMRTVAKALASNDQLKNEQADDMMLAFPYWEAGRSYTKGDIVTDPANGQHYILCQDTVAAEQYPPHGEGMLAIYRPIPKRFSDGTFLFVYGQNVFTGDVCLDADGVAWAARKDMLPCVWPPEEGNEWYKQGDAGDTEDTGNDGDDTGSGSDAPAEWVQPAGAHDAYNTGDRVTYNGAVWVCTADGNVYAPGVYGWEMEAA